MKKETWSPNYVCNYVEKNLTKFIEFGSFTILFLFGIVLSELDDASRTIAKQLEGLLGDVSFSAEYDVIGVFLSMFIFAAVKRTLILLVMQYQIAKKLDAPTFLGVSRKKIILAKLLQIAIVCAIFWFILHTKAYQRSLLALTESWLSVFSTALLIQIFFGAIGDALKQIIFCIFCVKH